MVEWEDARLERFARENGSPYRIPAKKERELTWRIILENNVLSVYDAPWKTKHITLNNVVYMKQDYAHCRTDPNRPDNDAKAIYYVHFVFAGGHDVVFSSEDRTFVLALEEAWLKYQKIHRDTVNR